MSAQTNDDSPRAPRWSELTQDLGRLSRGLAPEKRVPLTSGAQSVLVASAKRLTGGDRSGRGDAAGAESGSHGWQAEAWELFDQVGEFRFLATTLAHRLSQAKLGVYLLPEDRMADPVTLDPDDPRSGEISDTLEAIGKTRAGLSRLIFRMAIGLYIPGESWLVGVPNEEARKQAQQAPGLRPVNIEVAEGEGIATLGDGVNVEALEWEVYSSSEINIDREGAIQILYGNAKNDYDKYGSDEIYAVRIWRQHPRRSWEADSPTRASLPVLRELVGLTMHIGAQVDSRLAGAGVFLVPTSAMKAIRKESGIAETASDDVFTEALIEAMVTPIGDRSSASAVVPIVVEVPDEAAEKFRHISFSTELDGEARELRDEAIRRFALGQDAPPELLLGAGGMNHWGAWLMQEDVVKTHVEPPLSLICDALTTGYLWPILEQVLGSREEAEKYVVWYDISDLTLRPNHSAEALTLHERGVLTDEAVRRETGFDESDAPKAEAEAAPMSRAVEIAMRMVQNAPSLAQQPGLVELVRQLDEILAGGTVPLPEDESENGGAEDGSDTDTDGAAVPQTSTDDADPPSFED